MTSTQKRAVEIPLIFLIVWALQAVEISVAHLPGHLPCVQFLPVFISYFALTRGWGRLFVLVFVFSFFGSFTAGYSAPVYMAVQIWTSLLAKIVVSEFALEGRGPFSCLAAGSLAFAKTLTWFLLRTHGQAPTAGYFFGSLVFCSAVAGILGWFFFPLCFAWDEFFQHPVDEARELNPNILR